MSIENIIWRTDPNSEDRFAVSATTFADELELYCATEFDIQKYGFHQVPFRKIFDFDQVVGDSVLFYKNKPMAVVVQAVRRDTPSFVWIDADAYNLARKEFQKAIFKQLGTNGPRWTLEDMNDHYPEEGYSVNGFERLTRDMEIINTKTGEPFEFPSNGWQIDWRLYAKNTGVSPYDLLVKYQNQIEI